MDLDPREWTVPSSYFGVTIDFVTGPGYLGRFEKVSGLGVSVDIEEVAEGGENQYVHKLPGRFRWEDLEFERGLIDVDSLYAWLQLTSGNNFADAGNMILRHTGAITMFTADRIPLRIWTFKGAVPLRWSGPSFDASSDQVATEKLTVAHHGLIRVL